MMPKPTAVRELPVLTDIPVLSGSRRLLSGGCARLPATFAAWTLDAEVLPPGESKVRIRLRADLIADQLEPGKPLRTEESVTIVTPP